MKNTITLNQIGKSYGDVCVLDSVSLSITDSIALMGKSGQGKTTLARIIAGLESADSGEVSFDREPRISMVFQEDRLFADFDAVANVSAVMRHIPRAQARERAVRLLESLGIDVREHAGAVREFSGGMSRRVAIARALAVDADVLILDEPYKGLDEETRERVASVIRECTAETLVILITHDACEAELTGITEIITLGELH